MKSLKYLTEKKNKKGLEQGIWLLMVIVLCLVVALVLITIFRQGTREAGNQTGTGIDQSAGGVYDVLQICGCAGVCSANCTNAGDSCQSSSSCS